MRVIHPHTSSFTANQLAVPMSHLTREERYIVENAESSSRDPSIEFDRKISRLADYLSCTEEEATRIFLHNL